MTISDAALIDLYWHTTRDDWAVPDWVMVAFGRAVLRLAAASPTPTGPEPAKCEDCGWPWPLPGRPPTGAECDSCGGDLVPAIPEPTEETP